MSKRIIILGGTGSTGLKITEGLLKHTNAIVTIAARNSDKINQTVGALKAKYPKQKISGEAVDATDRAALEKLLSGNDILVVASGTSHLTENIVKAALAAKIDYIDLQYSPDKIDLLKKYKNEIKNNNRLFITDAGFHPGLPAVIVRHGTEKIENIVSANIYSAIKHDWQSTKVRKETKIEFVRELANYEALFFSAGKWKKARLTSMKDLQKFDFGEPIGKKLCSPMLIEELKALPLEIPTLKETGFFIAGFSLFIDMLLMPFAIIWMKIFKELGIDLIANLMFWSLQKSSKPPFRTILLLEAKGKSNTEYKLKLYHKDAYLFTAVPVVACLIQYIEGLLPSSGLFCMGNIVEPARLLQDMKNLGIIIEENQ